MAQTINIPEIQLQADVKAVSPSKRIPNNMRSISVTLVSSEWVAKAGQGFLTWGIERSDDGVNWFPMNWIENEPFGTMGKGIYMPHLGCNVGGHDLSGNLRLFAQATAPILVGATVVVDRVV